MSDAIAEGENPALGAGSSSEEQQWVVPRGKLATRTAAAALQDMLMAPRVADLRRCNGPEKSVVLHAVGADVVKLFLAPARNARAGRQMALGYSEVFEDDRPELGRALAALLAEAIWFGLHDAPLLLLPPIDDQLERIVAAIGADAQRPSDDARHWIEGIRNRLARHQTRLTHDDVELLWKAAVADGPGAELARLKRLLDKHRICACDSQLAAQTLAPFVSVLSGASSRELAFLRDRTHYWNERFSAIRGTGTRRHGIDSARDQKRVSSGESVWKNRENAEAMARLELINRRLERRENGSARLLYITGDTTLFIAGRDYVPSGQNEDFATLYLRHPRAYLGEPGVLAPSDRGAMGSSLADLLTIWLGDFAPLRKSFRPVNTGTWRIHVLKAVQERIAEVEISNPSAHDQMLTQWNAITAHVRLPPRSMLEDLEDSATTGSPSFPQLLANSRARIEDEFDQAFNDLFDVITELRFAIAYTAPHGPRERPGICFEQQNELTALFRSAELWKQQGFDREVFRHHRDAIRRLDPSGYFLNLAHAWLLASFGHWVSAAIFARRSMSAVTNSDAQTVLRPDEPNGREAAYLLAVCLRHAAKGIADLIESRYWLDKAEDITKREQLGASSANCPPDIVRERFATERLSTELTELLFDWAGSRDIEERRRRLTAMRRCADQSLELAAEIQRRMNDDDRDERQRPEGSIGLLADMPPLDHRINLRCQAARRLLRNALGVALMDPGDLLIAETAWTSLSKLPRRDPNFGSGFGYFQDLCARALFGPSPALGYAPRTDRERDLAVLEEQRRVLATYRDDPRQRDDAPEWASQLLVFPYDVERFLSWIHTVQINAD